jgi:hypothetical protein
MVVKMNENFCYFVLDPREYKSPIAPLAFLKKCCKGCENENDGNSHLNGLDRMDRCDYCIKGVIEPAYRRKLPFTFKRKTGETKIVK